ncbi:MAG TPA: phosphatidylserine/phosphatidylglycerophosphate/cardiolipin synthase family protein [Solirubrobacteraceae bacterium]|jgi:phosphatidylserine/phosphatidylglycerophosphate/cardiolipin synthase-like enzyme
MATKATAKDIQLTFLRDTQHGGAPSQPADIANMLADFIDGADATLDVAIYDFRLSPALAEPVVKAFKAAAARGVKVRIGYDANKPKTQTTAAFFAAGADPAPPGTEDWLKENFSGSTIELKPIISPGSTLMHSKYIVRDGASAKAAVWMGSANFTDGAWTRQENNILRFTSPALAAAYTTDFKEMWDSGIITRSGAGDEGTTRIDGTDVSWAFSPGEGVSIDAHLVSAIKAANKRLRVSSMVLTSHAVLEALAQAIDRGVDVAGIYDGGEMRGIEAEWHKSAASAPTLALFKKVAASLVAKPSSTYSDTGPHDFMHNKVLVSDDLVLTGSYNFSKHAESNAENQLSLADADIAEEYATYIDELVTQYR